MTQPSETPPSGVTIKDVYAEVGVNYRYFLTWRQRIFAGYLAVLGALGVAAGWLLKESPHSLWLLAGAGFLLTVVFGIIERRNRDLYRKCVECGAACEVGLGGVGIYVGLQDKPKGLTQSFGIDLLFIIMAIFFLVAGAVLTFLPICFH